MAYLASSYRIGGKQIAASLRIIAPSVCPHDCTSTCALDVEILDGRTIGRVRGSQRNAYTAGVICEKVGRYAERVHHPAEAFIDKPRAAAARRCGRTSTPAPWAWCSATASTGCATR
jgi:anaerobic selenocysteine-containing dehydrogenase